MTNRTPLVELRLFGPFDARLDGQTIPLRNRKADRLLAYLALRDRILSSDIVLEEVWGPQDESTLNKAVGELRQILGEKAVELRHQTIRLMLSLECDVQRFDRGIASTNEQEVAAAVELYTEPLLVGWNSAEDGWVQRERERRKELYLDKANSLCQTAISRNDYSRAAHLAHKLVSSHPEYQQGWYSLLYALDRQGERNRALQVAQQYEHLMGQPNRKAEMRVQRLIQQLRSDQPQDASPLPISGPLSPDNLRYVVRPADQELRRCLYEGQWTILIQGPHQTGKSSLLARGLAELRQGGHITIATDFSTWVQEDIEDAQRLCRRLAETLLLSLQETRKLKDFWIEELAPGAMLTDIVRQQLQRIAPRRLIWAMDGLDRLFGSAYQESFFAQLRHWHSQHALHPDPWNALSLVLVCSREPHLYIRDLNQSPFNVSTPVRTEDLRFEEAEELHKHYGSPIPSEEERIALYTLLGGHPGLLQRALTAVIKQKLPVPNLLIEIAGDDGIFSGHLRRIGAILDQSPAFQEAVQQVLAKGACQENAFYELRSVGILKGQRSSEAVMRCPLYEYFLSHRQKTK